MLGAATIALGVTTGAVLGEQATTINYLNIGAAFVFSSLGRGIYGSLIIHSIF
jgi:hypothetical protein